MMLEPDFEGENSSTLSASKHSLSTCYVSGIFVVFPDFSVP